jgi:hypothetical protein
VALIAAPFGFSQRQGLGSAPTYENYEFGNGGIDYNTAAIYFGDPVERVGSGDGTIQQAPGGAGASTVPLAGIFIGCKYLSTAQKRTVWGNYWPGSDVTSANQSSISAWVINDPHAQFLVQSDATGVTQAQLGGNIDFAIGTGTPANGISGASILHTAVVTSGYPFRLQSLVTGINPQGVIQATGAYNYAIVGWANVETTNMTAPNT